MFYSLNIFLSDLWFPRYRECPCSGTVRIRLLSPTCHTRDKYCIQYTKGHLYIYALL